MSYYTMLKTVVLIFVETTIKMSDPFDMINIEEKKS